MFDPDQVLALARTVAPSWTMPDERRIMAELAHQVKPRGRIVEIGSLYGGMTAVLALSNPQASVVAIDNFSWSPDKTRPPASRQQLEANMRALGISNVSVIEGSSREISPIWNKPIDLLWIDGGHNYESVFSDLIEFSPFADVIALHDYGNKAWPTIRKAIEDFLFVHREWWLDQVVNKVAVLRKKEAQ